MANTKSYIGELDAVKDILKFVNEADLDDLAAIYSRFLADGIVVVTGDNALGRLISKNSQFSFCGNSLGERIDSEPYLDGDLYYV